MPLLSTGPALFSTRLRGFQLGPALLLTRPVLLSTRPGLLSTRRPLVSARRCLLSSRRYSLGWHFSQLERSCFHGSGHNISLAITDDEAKVQHGPPRGLSHPKAPQTETNAKRTILGASLLTIPSCWQKCPANRKGACGSLRLPTQSKTNLEGIYTMCVLVSQKLFVAERGAPKLVRVCFTGKACVSSGEK